MLVEGEKLIREALSASLAVAAFVCDEAREPALRFLLYELEASGARAVTAPEHVLKAVCDTVTPQGVCAAFALPKQPSINEFSGNLVALDGVSDPGNVGTIWRTADAAGFKGLLFGEGCADAFSPKVQRAAMGSSFRLHCASGNLVEMLTVLKRNGTRVVATALGGQDIYQRKRVPGPFVLVVGSEAHGIGRDALDLADEICSIPMRGGAESLNAAVAAGIAMYELTRNEGGSFT